MPRRVAGRRRTGINSSPEHGERRRRGTCRRAYKPPGKTTFVEVDPPAESVEISPPNGKDVSHYSVTYVPDEGPSS